MKAIQVIKYGDAQEGLDLREVPEPAPPGEGEVLVEMHFAPINRNDLMVVWGIYSWRPVPPATIGNEGVGKIIAIGTDVAQVSVGDFVVMPFMSKTFQERVLVPANQVVRIPEDADKKQASMLAINAFSASLMLSDYVDLQKGDAVVFNSATSGLSHWLSALAKKRGLRTIGLVRRAEDVERVKAAGCEIVIVDDEDLDVAKKQFSDLNVRLALDGVGGPSSARLISILSEGGKIVVYGAANATRAPMEVPSGQLIFKNVTVEGFYMGHAHNLSKMVPTLQELVEMIGKGGVRQPIARVYGPDEVKLAVSHAVAGGKVMLRFSGEGG